MAAPAAQRLGLLRLIAYSLPALPLAVITLPVYIFLPAFYAEFRGVDLAVIGLILVAARVFDALSDPLIGVLSDRMPPRLGRRKPFLLVGTPVTMLAVYMLFAPPVDAGASHFLVWSLLLTLAWTLVIIPYNAWGAELSGNYEVRTRVTATREVFIVLGTLMATAAPALGAAFGVDKEGALEGLALAVVLVLPLAIAIALLTVAEPAVFTVARVRAREGWRALSRNAPFRRLITAYLFNGVANGLPASLFVLFVSDRIGRPDLVGPLLFAYFLAGVISVPFWWWLAKRWGKHRTWVFAMIWAAVAFVPTPFLVHEGDVALFLAICIMSGFGVGADLSLPASIQADVVDVDTLESGEQRTGLYFALWGVATKLALALAAGVAFPALDAAGFVADRDTENTPLALFVLSLLYAGLPVVLKLVAAALMWRFPLDEGQQRLVRIAIERRASGQA